MAHQPTIGADYERQVNGAGGEEPQSADDAAWKQPNGVASTIVKLAVVANSAAARVPSAVNIAGASAGMDIQGCACGSC
eukprot:2559462-Pleurochrysis_carterae.AAC.1